ncbi:MAG: MBOAT family protein [Planctomycetota bacterium]
MIFTSYVFLFWYLPLVLAVYYALPLRGKNVLLTLVSYVFYGWWRPDFVALMLVSTVVDHVCALRMGEQDSGRRRKLWLWASMVTNLGLLAWFKYANLVVDSINWFVTADGGAPIPWEKIILPVGISFYTFQSMSYTIDVYFGKVKPVRSILDLACYVSMFPQLVAGPIVRYRSVMAQITRRTMTTAMLSNGALLFMIGFAKKVLVADTVAPLADAGFAAAAPGLIDSWIAVLAYTIQIYFDFSGYSDMAIGLGLLIGFRFPRNFLSPYHSQSITEFWRRWHISLSTWLRDYLYIPLGGNQKGGLRTYVNLMATMLLGGLWHGAAWTFVLWGAYQGGWLVAERRFGRRPFYGRLPLAGRVACTFVLAMIGWTIFRADSMANLMAMWGGMFGAGGLGAPILPADYVGLSYVALGTATVLVFACRDSWTLVRAFHPVTVVTAVAAFALVFGKLLSTDYSPFLYFQF